MERKIQLWLVFFFFHDARNLKRMPIRIRIRVVPTHHSRRLLIRYAPCRYLRWVRVKIAWVGKKESGVVEGVWSMIRNNAEVATSSGAFAFVCVLVTAESLGGVELAWTVLAREETVDGRMLSSEGVFLVP